MFIVRANAVIDGTNVGKLNSIEAFNNPKDASRYNSTLLRAFVDAYCGRGLSLSVDKRQPELLSDVHVDDVGVNLLSNFKAGRRVVSDVSVVGRWCRLDLEVVNAEAHREFPHTVAVGDSLVVADPSCSSFDGSSLLINDVVPGSWRFAAPKVMTRDDVVPRELVFSLNANVQRSNWETAGVVNVNDGLVGIFDSSAFSHAIDDHKRWYTECIAPNLDEPLMAADVDADHFVVADSGHAEQDYCVYVNRDKSSKVIAVKVDFTEER